MGTTTKNDLVAIAAEKTGLAKSDVMRAIDALLGAIQQRALAGETVRIAGFGQFKTKLRKARLGRNPSTGAELHIPESTVLAFKPSKPKGDAA